MNRFLFILISFYFISTAEGQTVDFTFSSSNGLFCNPSTIQFTQTCTGNPTSFLWNFGNNQFGDKSIESVSYLNAGTYTVKLTAIFANTTLSVSKTITINPAVSAAIAFDKDYICQPGIINFTGSGSGNINNYEWDFGDGSPVVSNAAPAISHSFTSYGIRNVLLKTSSAAGCTDTISKVISIKKLVINGTVSQFRGCVPATVNFKANVVLPLNSTVTSYTWNYGDGSPADVTTVDGASHVYPVVGNYSPTVTVTTNEGCANTFNFRQLTFGTPPVVTFSSVPKDPVCASDSAIFILKATNATRYFWDFGDGSTLSTTDTIAKHKFKSLGLKRVVVFAYYNECPGVKNTLQVTIIGVIANYSFANTCSDKNIYSFSDSSLGVPTSRQWNFGDGTPLSNAVNPLHPFPLAGQFTTTLQLFDNVSGCADTVSKIIYTANPTLASMDSSVCINKTVNFSIVNNYTDTAARYTWHVLGDSIGPLTSSAISVVADSLGNFNNFVVIYHDKQSCRDTLTTGKTFVVKGPKLDFILPATNCSSTPLLVTNNSQPFVPADAIQTWNWNFGVSNSGSSAFQPTPFLYGSPGTYTIKLIATDINGCEDTLSKNVIVNPSPFIKIFPASDTLCFGQSVTMMAYHSNNLVWSPAGNITCATCDTTIATPFVSTKYFGTATNSFNCSVQDSNYIKILDVPFTTSITPEAVTICQFETATVDVNPKGKKILWTPATGLSDATSYNPVIAPLQNTAYTVTLTYSTGCVTGGSSATVNVFVKPAPTVAAGPDMFFPKGTTYTLAPVYSSNVVTYLWTPSLLLTCNNCATPSGINDYTQQYIIKVTSDSGCVASDSITIAVECKSANIFIPKAFTPNNDNLNDYFYPTALGVQSIAKFTIYNRQGRVVFEAVNFKPNDKLYGWNGKFKGVNQSVDTYVYSLEAICESGEKLYKKGSFLLLK